MEEGPPLQGTVCPRLCHDGRGSLSYPLVEGMPIEILPIGYIQGRFGRPRRNRVLRAYPCWIHIYPRYWAGLSGLSPGDRILVLFWMDRACRGTLLVHPRGDKERPLRGVFATRSPHRPNPIGATVARVLEVRGGAMLVDGLDALDGTPVLDIKIHAPEFDGPCP